MIHYPSETQTATAMRPWISICGLSAPEAPDRASSFLPVPGPTFNDHNSRIWGKVQAPKYPLASSSSATFEQYKDRISTAALGSDFRQASRYVLAFGVNPGVI
jgi:hypothetical protein